MKRIPKKLKSPNLAIPYPDYDGPSWRRTRLGAIIDFFDFDSILIIPLPTKKRKPQPPLVIFKHLEERLTTVKDKKGRTHPANHIIFWSNKELAEIPLLFKDAYGKKAIDSLYQGKTNPQLKDDIIEIPIKLFQMKGNDLNANELKETKKYLRYFEQLPEVRGRRMNVAEHKLILKSTIKVLKKYQTAPKKLPTEEILDTLSRTTSLADIKTHDRITNISPRTVERSINSFLNHLSCFRSEAFFKIKKSKNPSSLIANYLSTLPNKIRKTKPPLKLRS